MNARQVEYNGIIYPSYKSLCESFRVDYDLFCKRKSKGMSVKEALTTPVGARRTIIYDGQEFYTYKALAVYCKVNPSMLCHYLKRGHNLSTAIQLAS